MVAKREKRIVRARGENLGTRRQAKLFFMAPAEQHFGNERVLDAREHVSVLLRGKLMVRKMGHYFIYSSLSDCIAQIVEVNLVSSNKVSHSLH